MSIENLIASLKSRYGSDDVWVRDIAELQAEVERLKGDKSALASIHEEDVRTIVSLQSWQESMQIDPVRGIIVSSGKAGPDAKQFSARDIEAMTSLALTLHRNKDESSMQRWKLMAEYQYALRAYPDELALGCGALDATMQTWTGEEYRAVIDAYIARGIGRTPQPLGGEQSCG